MKEVRRIWVWQSCLCRVFIASLMDLKSWQMMVVRAGSVNKAGVMPVRCFRQEIFEQSKRRITLVGRAKSVMLYWC